MTEQEKNDYERYLAEKAHRAEMSRVLSDAFNPDHDAKIGMVIIILGIIGIYIFCSVMDARYAKPVTPLKYEEVFKPR